MKKSKTSVLGAKISLYVLLVEAAVFAVLTFCIVSAVSALIRNVAEENMQTAAIDRSQMILMYKSEKEDDGLGETGTYSDEIIKILDKLPISGLDNAEYYLIDASSGEYIIHPDSERIYTPADEGFASDIISMSANGQTSGCLSYKENGEKYIAAYNTLSNENWIFIVSDASDEVLSSANVVRKNVIVLFILSAVAVSVILYNVIKKNLKPLGNIEAAVCSAADIHFDAAHDIEKYIGRKDEIGSMASAVNELCTSMKNASNDIGRILGEMADENFAVDTDINKDIYKGDFSVLFGYISTIKDKLTDVLSNIYEASDQVTSGSVQVAQGAQALSAGAVEQTASVDELVNRLGDIGKQVQSNSESCAKARDLMNKTSAYVDEVSGKMETLTEAMSAINDSSAKIGNIIKTIEDIAFQTNILALNAAVEAARAGAAGKGFAVVADEVRNLAAKSAEAVSDTTKLIDSSIEAVNNGAEITGQTNSAMQTLDEYTAAVRNIVDSIAESGEKQAEMVGKINEDVKRISGVVQANSATAEESAAASEELSGQADTLKDLIGKFTLK